MAQGKLSEQIAATQQQEAQRPTRTQRLQVLNQQRRDQERFERLKAEAERVQQEQFKDKTVQEQYTIQVPREYVDRYGNPTREWERMSERARTAALRNTSSRNIVNIQRTRETTIPFTLDEGENSYEKVYETLSPELKDFFVPPQQLKQEKTERITTNITRVEERITAANAKIAELKQKYEQRRQELQEWWSNKSSSYRSNPSNRESYDRNRRDLEDDYEEDVEYQRGIIEGLSKGKSQLASQKDISFETIFDYAQDLANYYEQREDARNTGREQQRVKQKEIDTAIAEAQQKGGSFVRIREEFKGTPQGEKIYAVSPTGKYTLISEAKPSTAYKGAEPSAIGLVNVSQAYKVGKVQLTFSGTEPTFKTGTGKLITAYGDLGTTEADVLESQRLEEKRQSELRQAQASAYLSEKGFDAKATAPIDEKRSFFGKTFDYVKAAYGSTIFGTSLKMPEEYLEQRKKIGVSGSPIGIGLPTGVSLYGLDFGKSLEGVRAERTKNLEAQQQVELVNELGRLTEEAPEELQYDIQQRGLETLKSRGLTSTFDEKTGVISFSSSSLKPSESYNIYEYRKAKEYEAANVDKLSVLEFTTPERKENISLPFQTRGTAMFDARTGDFKAAKTEVTIPAKTTTISPYSLGVGTRIAATKAAEIFLISKGAGAILGGIGKGASGLYKGLGGGLKITDATVRAGRVTATVEPTFVAKLLAGKTGTVLKVTGTGILYAGAGTLFVAGKVRQRQSYISQYGDIGRDVYKYETIGEVAGLAAVIGEGIFKKSQARKLNEQIARENFAKQQRYQRIKNIKEYGQYSRFAQTSYEGAGRGTKLRKDELDDLARIYAEATGVSRKTAIKRVQEGALYRQTLRVKSPAGFETYETNQYSLLTATKSKKISQELAFEFTRVRGGRFENLVLKATTGRGKYAFTSVFERGRFRPTQVADEFILKKTVISKIVKSRGAVITTPKGDIKIRQFDVEQRLVKSLPTGRTRYDLKEVLEVGLPKYRQADLARVFTRAGISARTSPKPISNVRVEFPNFREFTVGGRKVEIANTLREFNYIQKGSGGRQVALKNILRDIDFKSIERALQGTKTKTPLSKTFGADTVDDFFATTQPSKATSDVRKIALRNALKQTEADRIASLPKSVGGGGKITSSYAGTGLYERGGEVAVKLPKATARTIDISPTVTGDFKVRVSERLLGRIGIGVGVGTSPALAAALLGALGLRQKDLLKAELRSKQLQQQGQVPRQVPRTDQVPRSAQAQASLQIPDLQIPSVNVPNVPPTTSPPSRPASPTRPVGFPDADRLLQKLLRQKKEKGVNVDYLIPDFASKALGIEPLEVGSAKEALREIGKIRTPFELRRGIRIRSNRRGGNLLKGIMN